MVLSVRIIFFVKSYPTILKYIINFQNAACYSNTEEESDMTMESETDHNLHSNAASSSACPVRRVTLPRSHRGELPAVVTEGDSYRMPGEVRLRHF